MRTPVDDADLVVIAATAIGAEVTSVVDATDMAALARVALRIDDAGSTEEAAAAALVGILRHRPFPSGNAAAAWLTAAHLLAAGGRIGIDDSTALSLVARARTGDAGEAEVAEVLRKHVPAPGGALVRVLRRLFSPAEPVPAPPVTWPCPLCARPVEVAGRDAGWMIGPDAPQARAVLIAGCRRTHGTHRRPERMHVVPAPRPGERLFVAPGRRHCATSRR